MFVSIHSDPCKCTDCRLLINWWGQLLDYHHRFTFANFWFLFTWTYSSSLNQVPIGSGIRNSLNVSNFSLHFIQRVRKFVATKTVIYFWILVIEKPLARSETCLFFPIFLKYRKKNSFYLERSQSGKKTEKKKSFTLQQISDFSNCFWLFFRTKSKHGNEGQRDVNELARCHLMCVWFRCDLIEIDTIK